MVRNFACADSPGPRAVFWAVGILGFFVLLALIPGCSSECPPAAEASKPLIGWTYASWADTVAVAWYQTPTDTGLAVFEDTSFVFLYEKIRPVEASVWKDSLVARVELPFVDVKASRARLPGPPRDELEALKDRVQVLDRVIEHLDGAIEGLEALQPLEAPEGGPR